MLCNDSSSANLSIRPGLDFWPATFRGSTARGYNVCTVRTWALNATVAGRFLAQLRTIPTDSADHSEIYRTTK